MATLLYWGWCWGGAVPAWAAPTPAQILNFKPHQPGVDCTTPTAEQLKGCKVELIKQAAGRKGSGWLLSDAVGPIRRFFDTDGDNKIDTWSYYKDGVEVYREIDTNRNGKPDQFRWLNGAGMKWGVDQDEDGRIDSWKAISPEEVSQELLQAVATRDYARLQALLLTEAEIKALALAPAEAQRLRASLAEARSRFAAALDKLKGMEKASWLHLETASPQCRAAEAGSAGADVVRHVRGTILYDAGGKNDWLQTGEMIQVGAAWRLVGGPTPGGTVDQVPASAGPVPTAANTNPALQKLIEALAELDKAPPPVTGTPGPNAAVAQYNLKRADILEKILAEVKGSERDMWLRQVADSLSTAVENTAGDPAATGRLGRLEQQVATAAPGSPLAAYVVYRRLLADYAVKLLKQGADYTKVQQEWKDNLTRFVSTYPKAEDLPDALLQLGMVCEFLTRDTEARKGEPEAKKWYAQLAAQFGDKPQGIKARGAVRRLESEGKEFELNGPLLEGGVYDIARARGKVVVVYYWASLNPQAVGDFARLKQLVDSYGSKGFEVVSVNLDATPAEASAYLKRSPAPGTHLYQAGSLESKLATDYGIMVPPHLFLVGKDGKVVSRAAQVGTLEDELKKLLK
jgi:hypothetical protein